MSEDLSPTSKILTEDTITLREAAGVLEEATGRRPHISTIFRWCTRGSGGIRLEHVRMGRDRFTSIQALTRFLEARTNCRS